MKLLIAMLLLTATLGCVSPNAAYVEADRLTYESVGLEYQAYVDVDSNLSAASKAIRRDKMASWKDRIDAAKKAEGQ